MGVKKTHPHLCIGSFILLVVVVLIGSAVFSALERPAEIARQEQGQQFIDRLQDLLITGNPLNNSDVVIVMQLLENKGVTIQNPDQTNWDFDGSFYFVVTVVTTIGYGTFCPTTQTGKAMVVIFGVVGLGIAGFCMGNFTTIIGASFDTLLRRCSGTKEAPSPQMKARVIFGMALVLWIVFGASMAAIEGWTFMIGVYFSFVTLSTIGFGDYAPAPGQPAGMTVWFIGVIFGIGLVGLAIGIVGDVLSAKVSKIETQMSHVHREGVEVAVRVERDAVRVVEKIVPDLPPM